MTNQVCTWDFTIKHEGNDITRLKICLGNIAKKWCFQIEKGEQTGYVHYQGRMSLKMKERLPGVVRLFQQAELTDFHLSITSSMNKDNMFYVMKPGQIDGPWKDDDEILNIPRQVKDIVLDPWQGSVVVSKDEFDTRSINVILDFFGNIGKSTLATFCGVNKLAVQIPPMENHKDIMRMVYDKAWRPLYLIDIPRNLDKKKFMAIWAALEVIKSGYCYDDRNSFKEKYFDCPAI